MEIGLLIFGIAAFWLYLHYDAKDTEAKIKLAEMLLELKKEIGDKNDG